ncbi:MAG: hypothetical protein IPF97_06085 [Sphingomonadales bacterium]|nr:hypothetical protein [Sphingomonadales bacterium]
MSPATTYLNARVRQEADLEQIANGQLGRVHFVSASRVRYTFRAGQDSQFSTISRSTSHKITINAKNKLKSAPAEKFNKLGVGDGGQNSNRCGSKNRSPQHGVHSAQA